MTETTDACFKAKRLRDQALRLVRSEGRASGNIEVRGVNSDVSLNTNADDLASNTYCRAILMHLHLKPPGLLTILVRFDGLKVLNIAWDDARTAVLILKPGIWERWLAA